jgi:hypothetical protein
MSSVKTILAILALTIVVAITYGVSRSTPAIAAQKAQGWEYSVTHVLMPAKVEAIPGLLNGRGNQGWELVSVTENGGFLRMFFKRPK